MKAGVLTVLGLFPLFVKAATNDTNLKTLFENKRSYVVDGLTGKNQGAILRWLGNYTGTGQFNDINYASGCDAIRANWPAQQHWIRLRPIAAVFSDLVPTSSSLSQKSPKDFVSNGTVKGVLDSAMGWWFDRNFNVSACLDQGGVNGSACPCGTPGMWNPNWYANVLSIPQLSGETCLLYNDTLSAAQRQACASIGDRAYVPTNQSLHGVGLLTGSNALDLADVGVLTGLIKYFGGIGGGAEQVLNAYQRAHAEVTVKTGSRVDGVQVDGSFSQHQGVLYNGNYGRHYMTSILGLELAAVGTEYAAENATRQAIEKLVDGFQWMVYANNETSVMHWDLNTVGRMISYAVSDNQATASLKLNLSTVARLGDMWGSKPIQNATSHLLENTTFSSANAGQLVGNRLFWSNDYMVHRGSSYISTLKMTSNRTTNTECLNGQNLLGFHLGQGVMFNYVSGGEYEDVAASWDWNMLPGTTTAYAATPLNCGTASWSGVEGFVGGASTGSKGVAAMKWTNPTDPGTLAYHKAWFFLEDGIHHVLVPGVTTNSSSPIYTVLDQKRSSGRTGVFVDGKVVSTPANFTNATSLWHDGIGYRFDSMATGRGLQQLYTKQENRTGDWKSIGTSSAGNTTVNMFTAWIQHDSSNLGDPISFSVFPGTNSTEEMMAKDAVTVLRNDLGVSAVLDGKNRTVLAVFWGAGLNLTVPSANATIEVSDPSVLVLDLVGRNGSVSDPTQMLKSVDVRMTAKGVAQNVTVPLPSGGGSAVFALGQGQGGGGTRRVRRASRRESRRYKVRRAH